MSHICLRTTARHGANAMNGGALRRPPLDRLTHLSPVVRASKSDRLSSLGILWDVRGGYRVSGLRTVKRAYSMLFSVSYQLEELTVIFVQLEIFVVLDAFDECKDGAALAPLVIMSLSSHHSRCSLVDRNPTNNKLKDPLQ
jgi:hypothetical protein